MYTERNFKTKKALKAALIAGERVAFYQLNQMGFSEPPKDGTIYLEGPHYPEPHSWYAVGTVKDGVLVKIK